MKRSAASYNMVASMLLLGTLASTACGTDSTAPTAVTPHAAVAPSSSVLGGILATVTSVTVSAMLRTQPLANDIVVTAVIDINGGKIKVKETGFELRVPKGAVRVPTTFQVRALAGSMVAYEFEPHGMTFSVPLKFSQEFKLRELGSLLDRLLGAPPQIGYFGSQAQLNPATGSAVVSELQPAIVITDITGRRLEGNINHFSGYLVSCARR